MRGGYSLCYLLYQQALKMFTMMLGSVELATWRLFDLSMMSLQALTPCGHEVLCRTAGLLVTAVQQCCI